MTSQHRSVLIVRRRCLAVVSGLFLQGLGCGRRREPDEKVFVEAESGQASLKIRMDSIQQAKLLDEVQVLLDEVYAHPLPQNLPNWIAFHALLMYGDSAYGHYVSGDANGNLRRIFQRILHSASGALGPYVTRGNQPYPRRTGPFFWTEHHSGQFLTYLSLGGGALDTVITVDNTPRSLREALERSLFETRSSGELSYLVLAYSYFLDPGRKWTNKFGEPMSLARLVDALLKKDEETCQGTHRLAALARTLSRPELRNSPEMEIIWPELERQVTNAVESLKEGQEPSGFFLRPGPVAGATDELHQSIFFSGHSLEWLIILSRECSSELWVANGIRQLAKGIQETYRGTYQMLDEKGDQDAHYDFDGLTHALSALRRWRDNLQTLH